MDVLTWLIVGLVAGVLASFVMGGIGYGILGDIIVGIVGAVLGGFLFRALGLGSPFAGIAGQIFVAFIGAIVLLVILVLFGGTKLPQLARSLGKAQSEFKQGLKESDEDDDTPFLFVAMSSPVWCVWWFVRGRVDRGSGPDDNRGL